MKFVRQMITAARCSNETTATDQRGSNRNGMSRKFAIAARLQQNGNFQRLASDCPARYLTTGNLTFGSKKRRGKMILRGRLQKFTACVTTAAMLASPASGAMTSDPTIGKMLVPQSSEPVLPAAEMAALMRKHIKYVFVLYQENRSFDSYFGTFPGADGLFSQPAAQTPGYDHIDHSHPLTFAKMDVTDGHAAMDRFSMTEEKKYSPSGDPSLEAKRFGELAMAYENCDTIPILWRYADRFTLMDHVFEDMSGPSTPGNLSIFAAQTGETQRALHPDEAWKTDKDPGVPVINDDDPYWGSPEDPSGNKNVPVNPKDFAGKHPYGVQINQTYATLALSMAGNQVKAKTAQDENPKVDLDDVTGDIGFIQSLNRHDIAWRWFEEGFGQSGSDSSGPIDASGRHAGYITHHNGPQYFGYISNNPAMRSDLLDLHAFFAALQSHDLPAGGGLFYVKGGYKNIFGLKPEDPNPVVQKEFLGDDDHPAYSDSGISESLIARAVNAIAASPYWSQSAIIITWDDSEGDYDHVPPPLTAKGPDGSFVSEGPRVPMIVISPYARAHDVSHALGSQSSVVKFADAVFGLPPLASLPDEKKGFALGQKEFGDAHMGPTDGNDSDVSNLFSAFDPARLTGAAAPLPPSYAEVPTAWADELPPQSGASCKAVGITPTDAALRKPDDIPADFDPRPKLAAQAAAAKAN
jgi:phospholipase C